MPHSIVVRCPNCSQKYRLSPEKIGARARCKCGQRFTITSEKPLDEETAYGWVIQGADPSSHSVMGGSSITESPASHAHKEAAAPRRTPSRSGRPPAGPTRQPRVELELVDELGAQFKFPTALLADERLRDSFPKQCVCCGRGRRLNVHLIIWNEKLPADDPLRVREINHQPIGRLQSLTGYGRASWLDELPKLKNLPEPFDLPFPFFVCSDCTVEDEIHASLVAEPQGEHCLIRITHLLIAVAFHRNNGGSDTPKHQHLLQECEKLKKNRWLSLPKAVRRKITQWCEIEESEEFRGFFPDADFSNAELGKAGVVLTNKHLSFHKYSSSREFSLSAGGRVYLRPEEKNTALRIVQRGRKDATLHLDPAMADSLVSELRRTGRQWNITGQARDY
ncbi:MAG: hypothetical protein IID34_04910 [Planctomycetes bacterium]|nr:hypothetical protein [Planctomycetota bacterium]